MKICTHKYYVMRECLKLPYTDFAAEWDLCNHMVIDTDAFVTPTADISDNIKSSNTKENLTTAQKKENAQQKALQESLDMQNFNMLKGATEVVIKNMKDLQYKMDHMVREDGIMFIQNNKDAANDCIRKVEALCSQFNLLMNPNLENIENM